MFQLLRTAIKGLLQISRLIIALCVKSVHLRVKYHRSLYYNDSHRCRFTFLNSHRLLSDYCYTLIFAPARRISTATVHIKIRYIIMLHAVTVLRLNSDQLLLKIPTLILDTLAIYMESVHLLYPTISTHNCTVRRQQILQGTLVARRMTRPVPLIRQHVSLYTLLLHSIFVDSWKRQ